MTEAINAAVERLHAVAAAGKLGQSVVGLWKRDWGMLYGAAALDADARKYATPELVALATRLGIKVNWEAFAPSGAYDVEKDHILMPYNLKVVSPAPLARLLAHEIGHATGHASRMNRATTYGADAGYRIPYALDEITAEGFSFLVTDQLGKSSATRTAQYFANYRPDLEGDDAAYDYAVQNAVNAFTLYGRT